MGRKPESFTQPFSRLNLLLSLLIVALAAGFALFILGSQEPAEVARPLPIARPQEAPSPPGPGTETEAVPKGPATSSEPETLKVIAVRPTSQTFNYRDAIIEVEFSMPMNPEATEAAFSIDPPVAGTFSWPTPSRLVFTPQRLLDLETRYLVSIDDRATDATGFHRLPPTSWAFTTVGGYFYTTDIKPLVSSYCSQCHRAGGSAARISLDSYADVRKYVEPGNAEKSPFYSVLRDSVHRSALDKRVLAQEHLIRDWINNNKAGD